MKKVVKEDFIEKISFEQKFKGDELINLMDICGKNISSRRNRQCQDPKTGMSPECSGNSNETSIAKENRR